MRGCQGCGARLGGVIRTDSGHVSLENVNVHGGAAGAGGAFYCGGTGSLALQRVNLTDNTAELGSAGVVDGSCQLHWKHGYADGELLIAGANPQVNLTDVSLSSIHVVAGEDANVRLVRVQSEVKLEKVEDAVLKYQQNATVTARQTSSATFDWTCPLTPVTLTAKKEPLVFEAGEDTMR